MKSICNQFTDFNLLAFTATLLPVINLNLIYSLNLVAVMMMNPLTVRVIVMDPVGNDGDRFSDEFGDCSHGDVFDGVESLLLDENPISDNMFPPLYPGASVTICAAYCAIMTYAIANKLSYSAIENLLKLLHLLCPSSHQIPSSLYMLKKFFWQYTSSYEKKRVCPSCHCVLMKEETCPTSHGQNGHMVRVPIEKMLRSVLSKLICFTCIIKIVIHSSV